MEARAIRHDAVIACLSVSTLLATASSSAAAQSFGCRSATTNTNTEALSELGVLTSGVTDGDCSALVPWPLM
jgi:hypothetical protein